MMLLAYTGRIDGANDALIHTIRRVNEASNWLSQRVCELRTTNTVKIHHATYYTLREQFQLPASFACAVIRRVANVYKRLDKKRRFSKPIRFRPPRRFFLICQLGYNEVMSMRLPILEGRKPIFDRRYALDLLSAGEKHDHYCLGDSVVLPYGSFALYFLRFENIGYLRGDDYNFYSWSAVLQLADVNKSDFKYSVADRIWRDPSAELIYFDDFSGSCLEPLYGLEWSPPSWRRSVYRWCWAIDLADFNALRGLVDVSDDRASADTGAFDRLQSEVFGALRQLTPFSSLKSFSKLYSDDGDGNAPVRLSDKCCLVFADLGFGIPEYHNNNLPVVRVRVYEVSRTEVYGDGDGDDT